MSHTLTTSIIHWLARHPSSPPCLILEDPTQEEIAWVLSIEGSTQEVPTRAVMMNGPTQQAPMKEERGKVLI
jgi:hypothetical protein